MTDWDSLRIHVARLRNRHDLKELRKRPQRADTTDVDVVVEAQGIEISTSRIPDGSQVRVVGRIDAGLNELDVRVDVHTRWEGECRRCLELVEEPLELSVHAVFVDPSRLEAESDSDADTYAIDGDWIDLGGVVREELLLALPLAPLCSEECVGPDPDRFAPTGVPDEDEAAEAAGEIDPRWAALSELQFDED
ncbi:MAG: YceD family protein [Acidimicrobiales bacterium]